MPLPKIDLPIFDTILPSNNKKICYRAFTVKEEKLLLMAASDEADDDIILTVKQIINNCIVEPNDLDVSDLPFFDFEYLFIQIRSKSVGETVTLRFRHNENDCGHINGIEVPLEDVKLNSVPKKGKFMITDKFGVCMRYPSIDEVHRYQNESISKVFDLLSDLVQYFYDETMVYDDFSKKELQEFMESLPNEAGKKMLNFVTDMPTVKYMVDFKCGKCEKTLAMEVKSLKDFFV